MASDYDSWLMQDPEDDLPAWMFEIEDCPVCSEIVIDSVPSYAQDNDFGEYHWLDFCKCGGEEE